MGLVLTRFSLVLMLITLLGCEQVERHSNDVIAIPVDGNPLVRGELTFRIYCLGGVQYYIGFRKSSPVFIPDAKGRPVLVSCGTESDPSNRK